jgi:hypothetical protein
MARERYELDLETEGEKDVAVNGLDVVVKSVVDSTTGAARYTLIRFPVFGSLFFYFVALVFSQQQQLVPSIRPTERPFEAQRRQPRGYFYQEENRDASHCLPLCVCVCVCTRKNAITVRRRRRQG